MNRRKFITALSTITAASIFLPRAVDSFKWSRPALSGRLIINPAWITAKYERGFLLPSPPSRRTIFVNPDAYPYRYELRNGVLWEVPVFKITP